MTKETFSRAKAILETKQAINANIMRIEKMNKREGDDDFNYLRESAYDLFLTETRRLDNEFENL
jgi:hypothetical protein